MNVWKLVLLLYAAARAATACSCDQLPSLCKPFTRPDSRIEVSPNSATFVGRVTVAYPATWREFVDRQLAFALGHPELRPAKGRALTFEGLKQFLSELWEGKASPALIRQIVAAQEETRLNRRHPLEGYGGVVSLQVTEPFAGVRKGETIELLSPLSDCSLVFAPGQQYLVFAQKDEAGFWTPKLCSGTAPAREAADDIAALRLLRSGKQLTPYLTGTVSDHTAKSGRPVPLTNFPLRLLAENGAREFVSDPNGTFLLKDISPGKYRLQIVQPDWLFQQVSAATAPISVTPGCNEFDLNLIRTPQPPK